MIFGFADTSGLGIVSLETVAKLINLLIFVALAVYFLRRPLSEKLQERREGIRRDLMRAREDRDAAQAKLVEVEERLGRLHAEVEAVRVQALKEAEEERERIRRQTEEDAVKIRSQAQREIESISKAARAGLRAFAAEQSVRMAEELIRREMRPEDDARLVSEYVKDLGGVRS